MGERTEQTRGRDVRLHPSTRMEAFSDGVLAITMTLLAVDVRSPPHEPGRLLWALLNEWHTYVAFLASFLYIGVIWINHHAAFTRIRRVERGLKWANLGILLASALLPFPTAALSAAMRTGPRADEQAAVGLYALVSALMCASWLVFYHYLRDHPELLSADESPCFFQRERLRAWLGIVLYAGAGVLGCAIQPAVALAIFVAVPVFYAATSEGLPERTEDE